MYFYELYFHFEDDEMHIILVHDKEYSKHEFWKMCNKYFHKFPKNKIVHKEKGKEYFYYQWDEYECLDFIDEKLCEEYGFEIIDLHSKYYLASKIEDIDYLW